MLGLLFANGVLHYSYNQLSFMFLSRVTPLTHSIANAARRFAVISASVLLTGDHLNRTNKIGIGVFCVMPVSPFGISPWLTLAPRPCPRPRAVILILGVFAYVYARNKEYVAGLLVSTGQAVDTPPCFPPPFPPPPSSPKRMVASTKKTAKSQ